MLQAKIMNKYQVFIDVPQDEEWENIDVETIIVEAFNCDDAKQIAVREAEAMYEDCYVWEVKEEDKL